MTKDEDNDGNYESAIHYSYDVHGNAKTVLRDIPELDYIGKRFFRMDYEYELLSGNVKKLTYQDGEYDQFIHRYSYDANNRLRSVSTSSDGFVWTQDAKQLYNSIGTMARLELGQYQVQGLDYIYTINGWLKAINSVTLKVDRDPGHDGVERSLYLGSNNPHACFAQDAFGFALTYFKQKPDEVVICNNTYSGDNAGFEPTIDQGCAYSNAVYDLYNGNIASWSSGLINADETRMEVQAYVFRYDKLNRIKSANAWIETSIVGSNLWNSTATPIERYKTEYSYDYNGNILTLVRNGDNPIEMDRLSYGYSTNGQSRRMNNMLLGYNDAVGNTNYTTDIDDPGLGTFSKSNSATWNFIYDEVGNLIEDKAEEIDNIEWNVYGKVKKVTRFSASPASNKPDLEFVYDPMGNRICKIEKPRTAGVLSTQEDWKYIWYSLDAQGQTMAAYEQTYTDQGSGSYVLNFDHQETYIYGSSRVGVVNDEQYEIESTHGFTASIDGNTGKFINVVWNNPTMHLNCTEYCVNVYTRTVGMRQYELSNHLGNVQTTISDRRIAVSSGSNLDHYIADVISSTDYYPGGSLQPGRNSNSDFYRFGLNGQENDNEITGITGTHTTAAFWEYDTRLMRRWNVDPVTYPNHSSYLCFNGNPILYADPFGLYGTKRRAERMRRRAERDGLTTSESYQTGDEFAFQAWKENGDGVAFFDTKRDFSESYDKAISDFPKIDGCPYMSRVLQTAWMNNFGNPNLKRSILSMNEYGGPSPWMRDFNRAFGTTLNVGMAVPLAGEFLLPTLLETAPKFSMKFAGWKFLGSSLMQLTVNQRVDVFDATLDAVTLPGLSRSTLGGFVDANVSSSGFEFSTLGYGKSMNRALYDSGARFLFSTFGGNMSNQIGSTVKNGVDNAFYNFGKFYWIPTITNTVNNGIKNELFR